MPIASGYDRFAGGADGRRFRFLERLFDALQQILAAILSLVLSVIGRGRELRAAMLAGNGASEQRCANIDAPATCWARLSEFDCHWFIFPFDRLSKRKSVVRKIISPLTCSIAR